MASQHGRNPGAHPAPGAHRDPDQRSGLDVLGIWIDDVTLAGAVDRMVGWIDHEPDRLHHVVTVNPEFVVAARSDTGFRQVLQGADLATPDGVGITLAGRVLGHPFHGRVTGVELVEALAGRQDERLRIFLLGAGPGVAERAADALRSRSPAVRIVGIWAGSPRPEDSRETLRRIRAAGATVLLVAYGAPRQDLWIEEHRAELVDCGIVMAIGVGGTFDYLAGVIPRAPLLIRRAGLEWLYRLIRQPWRWRRQLALPRFVLLLTAQRLRLIPSDRQGTT
jgi:N-acetylglucosaminyldiphosphoundecaprenol N-acetyl-beta-D-mannosaminyltransferase